MRQPEKIFADYGNGIMEWYMPTYEDFRPLIENQQTGNSGVPRPNGTPTAHSGGLFSSSCRFLAAMHSRA